MKKWLWLGAMPILLFVALVYILSNYTHTGRVWALYTLAAPKAPLGVKYECVKNTNERVATKFDQPLNFTEDARLGLKEYWHFSYYRECLFKAGYDFIGNKIEPTKLTASGSELRYNNPYARVSFVVPVETELVLDNVTNPDFDDYKIASVLRVGDSDININVDRSYKLADKVAAETEFAGFDSVKDFKSETLERTPEKDVGSALAFTDGDYFGYVVIIPDKHIVTIFSDSSDQTITDSIAKSLKTL